MPADDPPADTPSALGEQGVDRAAAARATLASVPAEPGAAKPDPILVMDGLTRAFGGLTAVDVENLEIQRGCITGLIGPNGPARRRCSTCSPVSTGRTPGAGPVRGARSADSPRTGSPAGAWCAPSS